MFTIHHKYKILIILIYILTSIYDSQNCKAAVRGSKKFGYLRSSVANVRKGPGEEYKILWKFTKRGIPVELLYSMDNWLLIRDMDGALGWIHKNLISTRYTYALVNEFYTPLCRLPTKTEDCHKIGILSKNVILPVKHCNKNWCRLMVKDNLTGWVNKKYLWGV